MPGIVKEDDLSALAAEYVIGTLDPEERKRANALGKSLNQLIRDYLQTLAGGDNPERSIDEFRKLSGKGDSRGWRFNRDEIHERT